MNDVLILVFQALPYLIAAGLAVGVVVVLVFCSSRPLVAVLPIVLTIYLVSDISYGMATEATVSLLSRGAGLLLFPAFVWVLVAVYLWIKFAAQFAPHIVVSDPHQPALGLTPWFAAWAFLLCCHVMFALLTDAPFRDAVASTGFSNLLWMWLMIGLMTSAVRNGDDLKWLLRFMLIVGLGRAVFGLVRWAAFGGDPVNAYGNRHGLDLKLTFFDIYDSLICMLTITVAAMKLFTVNERRSAMHRAFLWVAMMLPALCIVLSFRRTAQVGLVVAGLFLLVQLPGRVRWWLALGAAPAALAGAGYAVWKRLSQTRQAGGAGDFLWDILPKTVGADSPRFIELKFAWASFLDHPIFGVGSWGGYEGWRLVSWQLEAGGGGMYLHSGVLHIGLKAGLVGFMLLAGLVATFILHWRCVRNLLTGNARVLAVAGMVGCIFVLPDFVISTSFTKLRATLFIGFCMSLPYVAAGLSGGLRRQVAWTPPPVGVTGNSLPRVRRAWALGR